MIIEPDLADAHYARLLRQPADLFGVVIREVFRVVRVNAGRGVNPIVALGQGEGSLEVVRAGAAPYRQQIAQSGGAGTRHYCRAVGVEVRIIEMSVRIQE